MDFQCQSKVSINTRRRKSAFKGNRFTKPYSNNSSADKNYVTSTDTNAGNASVSQVKLKSYPISVSNNQFGPTSTLSSRDREANKESDHATSSHNSERMQCEDIQQTSEGHSIIIGKRRPSQQQLNGYRFVDLGLLGSAFSTLLCPECKTA